MYVITGAVEDQVCSVCTEWDRPLPHCMRLILFFFLSLSQGREATSSHRMSVGFIGAGQLAHALVKGFTAAGEDGRWVDWFF